MSAIFATSIMLARESDGHSRNVRRRRLDVTTVSGPVGELNVCFEYRRINDLIRVVLPTPGGPTTATTSGGASSGRRSTRGTWSRFSLIYRRIGVSTFRLVNRREDIHHAILLLVFGSCQVARQRRLSDWRLKNYSYQYKFNLTLWTIPFARCSFFKRELDVPSYLFFSFDLRWALFVWVSSMVSICFRPREPITLYPAEKQDLQHTAVDTFYRIIEAYPEYFCLGSE